MIPQISFVNCLVQADVIERLRLQYKKDLLKVVDIVLSHQVQIITHSAGLPLSILEFHRICYDITMCI